MPGHFRFFCQHVESDIAVFNATETRHITTVLRFKTHDIIEFTDGAGQLFSGEIQKIEKDRMFVLINSRITFLPNNSIHLHCGIIKSTDKMDWIVEKCTELGVRSINFVACKNSERKIIHIEKLEKTAIEALKQSKGIFLPSIKLLSWKNVLEIQAKEKFIASISKNSKRIPERPILDAAILVGPEGDFTSTEIEEALTAGFIPVTLGNQILKTETAAISLVARLLI